MTDSAAVRAQRTVPQEKILIIKLGALGDFVQALGPVAAIRRHHPQADITLLTTATYVSLGRACGYVNHVWTDNRPGILNLRDWLALRRKLNEAGFTRVYDLQNNDRTAFYLRLFRAGTRPEWIGAAKGASHRNNTPERTAGHAFKGHIQTLALAGIRGIGIDDLSWAKGNIKDFRVSKPYVLLAPGSSPERMEKRWPATNYGTLARILDGWGYQPVIIGTKAEAAVADEIINAFPATLNLMGATSLMDVAVLAREAAAAIGNDTGPMHIIAATGCPSWVLFSRFSSPERHAPLGAQVTTIQEPDLQNLSIDALLKKISARQFR